MARAVSARWDGDMRSIVTIGNNTLVIGDDVVQADGVLAPMPTETLLAAVASCFTLAMAFVARKRDLVLPGLEVRVSASYDGPRLDALHLEVSSDADPDVVDALIPRARAVCYVTNTLLQAPEMTIVRA